MTQKLVRDRVIELRLDGMSNAEIAEMLGTTVNSVTVMICNAVKSGAFIEAVNRREGLLLTSDGEVSIPA